MRKAFYIDTFSFGHMHEMYDASSLLMFSSLYDRIDYYARSDSKKNVSGMLGGLPYNIYFHKIPLIYHLGRFAKLRRFLKQVQATLLNVYYSMKATNDTDIIINYYTVISIYPLNWYANFSQKRILLICHGEMSELDKPRSNKYIHKKSLEFFKKSDVKVAENLWFAVLGEGIKRNLSPLVTPQIQEKLLSFDHSAIFTNFIVKSKEKNKKLILGYIGGYRISKGVNEFLSIANYFKGNPKIEFRFIGKTENQDDRIITAGVVIPETVGNFFLSRDVLYKNILALDYAVYCFPPDDYRFTASGSIFDAIDCNTPILAISNDYFASLFDAYGDFGYLEHDLDSVKQRIIWLLEQKEIPVWNLEYVKKQLSPQNVAKVFCKTDWYK